MRKRIASLWIGGAVCSFLLIGIGAWIMNSASKEPKPKYVADEVIVKFHDTTHEAARANVSGEMLSETKHRFLNGAELWQLPRGLDVLKTVDILKRRTDVEYAEPNYIGEFTAVPCCDPLWPDQWAPPQIQMPDAWDITSGNAGVTIAILDTGIDSTHPDLDGSLWVNEAEVNGDPNVDDDNNGYRDDKWGWDFVEDDNEININNSHGTQVAGIVGAHASPVFSDDDTCDPELNCEEPSQEGIAGLLWDVRMMDLKVGSTSANAAAIAEAIDYAVDNGAKIINMSIALTCSSPPCYENIENAIMGAEQAGVLVVVGAGNNGINIDASQANKRYPASFTLPNIVVVAATDQDDRRVAAFPSSGSSNWGATSVDLGAPGIDIRTTTVPDLTFGNYYSWFSGTSASTPHVAGVAGLVRAVKSNMPYELVKGLLLDPSNQDATVDMAPNGTYPTVSGGRVNAFKVLDGFELQSPSAIQNLAAPSATGNSVSLTWTATGDDQGTGSASLYHMKYSTSTITLQNFPQATHATGEPAPPAASGTGESMTVGGLSTCTTYYFRMKAYDEWGNASLSNVVSKSTTPQLCVVSFCRAPAERCTANGTCGGGNCCGYTCTYDPTCYEPEECPPNSCVGCN